MIEVSRNKVFNISSDNVSYIFRVNRDGYLEHLYYGRILHNPESAVRVLKDKHFAIKGNAVAISREHGTATLEDLMLECSTMGRGDFRTPMLSVDGGKTVDLRFVDYEAYPGIRRFRNFILPQAIQTDRECSTLEVKLHDDRLDLTVVLCYTVFERLDAIVRKMIVINDGREPITLDSAASLQLDLPGKGYELISLHGAWGRERKLSVEAINRGTRILESRKLNSGAEDNPAFAIVSPRGEAIFSSLIYSGAHRETITATEYDKLHIVSGINPDMFSWTLKGKESFETPEAVLTYSENGIEEASQRFKLFTENAIYKGPWKTRLRPLMLTTARNGEYSTTEDDVLSLLKEAKKLEFDGIIIDDGWFSVRKSPDTGLGDWYVDSTKFPSGLKKLGYEIHRYQLMFGLYVEPEVVSRRSYLFEKHPEWVLFDEKRKTYSSTHDDFLLDLSNPHVQDWMVDTLSSIIETARIDYIKWDMHRLSSELISKGKSAFPMGEFAHRYIAGLYTVLNSLNRKYPNLYIETAAAGGARFDLGMLSYSASIALSECYDPFERLDNHEGSSLFYPSSAIKMRISPNPDRITGRSIEMETKFNLSLYSVLEYSVDILSLKEEDRLTLKQQIAFYLQYRQFLQFARVKFLEKDERILIEARNSDSSTIMLTYAQKGMRVNEASERIYIQDANENYIYSFFARPHVQSPLMESLYPQELEYYECSGEVIKWAGIGLSDKDTTDSYHEDMRRMTDYSSRLYLVKRKEN